MTSDELLSTMDAARLLGLSPDMVRLLARDGRLRVAVTSSRGARLFRRADVEELLGDRGRPPHRAHAMQLYGDDAYLATRVADYLGAGLRAGVPALVVATEPHRRHFVAALERLGFDVERARAEQRLHLLDAETLLETFLVRGRIQAARFRASVVSELDRLARRWPARRPRIYGEMVNVLWERGLREQALVLEALWCRLGRTRTFSLLCGYHVAGFDGAHDDDALSEVFGLHDRIAPAEQATQAMRDPRALAELEQRARRAEAEVRRLRQATRKGARG